MVTHLALVSETEDIPLSELTLAAAAVSKQISRDFGPLWGIEATLDAFASLDDVPTDYQPIIIRDDGGNGYLGYHSDRNRQPFSIVKPTDGWPVTVSHEALEMLGDPWGSRFVAGPSLDDSGHRVNYLVEVADPSEAYTYTINGVYVSDFYTPNFFDPEPTPGVRYSYLGKIERPRQVLPGGYISWYDPEDDQWYQQTWFGQKSQIRTLGRLPEGRVPRSWVDEVTRPLQEQHAKVAALAGKGKPAGPLVPKHQAAQAARAQSLRGLMAGKRRP